MNAREQLLQRQKSVLEEALLRQLVMCEWAESVACAFAFDIVRAHDQAAWLAEMGAANPTPRAAMEAAQATLAKHFSDALAVARGLKP